MKNLALIVFFAVVLLHLLGIALANHPLVQFSKPLLMPTLGAWLFLSTQRHHRTSFLFRAMMAALVFSTLGDVLLMFSGQLFFLLGLFSFLMAHVFYIGAFVSVAGFKNGFLARNPLWSLPFLTFPVLLLIFLWDGIPAGMSVPVAIYAGVIAVMALSVLNLKGRIVVPVFTSLFAGALFFMLSDSLLALNKFGQPFEGAGMAIMVTYILGQFLLVRGVEQRKIMMEKQ